MSEAAPINAPGLITISEQAPGIGKAGAVKIPHSSRPVQVIMIEKHPQPPKKSSISARSMPDRSGVSPKRGDADGAVRCPFAGR